LNACTSIVVMPCTILESWFVGPRNLQPCDNYLLLDRCVNF
jgi:hypothetical protein